MDIAIYTLTSELHDAASVEALTNKFLASIDIDCNFRGSDFADFGRHDLSLIYVRTGGTEAIFRRLLPQLQTQCTKFYLLASGQSNSLAASMEILSYLRQQRLQGEILHGTPDYVRRRITTLARAGQARRWLRGRRLGVIGRPSDWLIASTYGADQLRQRLGIELVELPIEELTALPPKAGLEGAMSIYEALKAMAAKERLDGFTLRCFDLLTTVRNTGCLALARLNAEGMVAGCEGDVPAMLSMLLTRALTGTSGFQSNPACIDPDAGMMTLAHCTIPLDMVERYELDTHFESGLGIGIRGYMRPGPVTIFKVAGDLSRWFAAEGQLLRCEQRPDLCRTQLVVELADKADAAYFLSNPIGNHHIVVPGHVGQLFGELLSQV